MAKKKPQSIEPKITEIGNGWLKKYKLDYKLEHEHLNNDIDKALADYFTKNGGTGANRPDAKLLLIDEKLRKWPILIEYKGYKDRLVKLDEDGHVANKTKKNEHDFSNINKYAVNGAVHYANAILHFTGYTDIIAIGMTGYKDEFGGIRHEIGVYYVSKSNFGAGQKVGEYTDFSFLAPENFSRFTEQVMQLNLPQDEIERIKERRDMEIDISLMRLNNDIYDNEKNIGESDRVYLVAASIIATIGIPGKVTPLEKSDLKSSTEQGDTDGDIIGLLPSFNPKSANEYVDVIIPTGLDVFRNVIVASAAAVIAVGGGAGTLSEIANAWALKRLVVGYKNAEGWSAKLADTRLDDRIRYPDIPEDRVYGVTDAESALQIIDRYVERYDTYHMGITPGDK